MNVESYVNALAALARNIDALRAQTPLVQCLTNQVVMNFTANVLYAVGASPAMCDNPEEAAGFATNVASGVLVNDGTPSSEQMEGMRLATEAAVAAGKPWVLDPVAAGGLGWRTAQVKKMMDANPATILRGNASEILGFLGRASGRGVEATDSTTDAVDAARELARHYGCVVAVSGAVDMITDGDEVIQLANGSPLLTQVTGVGCALGAVMAAYASLTNPLDAAIAATSHVNIAAENAAAVAKGPGSFAVELLDALAALTGAQAAERVKLA
ncbi:MAG: hydroxyethylthiazole kinase [Propionibacterium sp.]|nr:hydroxyethylthiazole kinase [Propionibacterium sp.]